MAGPDTPGHEDDPDGTGHEVGGSHHEHSSVNWQASPLPRNGTLTPAEDSVDEGAGGAPAQDLPDWDEEPEQLSLSEEDVSLPWLEGDGDEAEYEGYSLSHVLGLVVLGLVVMGLIVGGIWYATRAGVSNGEIVADGSTIEAPEAPYKERPDDPGGKTFEGTGDTSFAVSQGETRPARLGEEGASSGASASPGFESVENRAVAPVASPAASVATPPSTAVAVPASAGIGVQVGAFSTREAAEAGWTRLASQYSSLSGVKHRVVEGRADIGKVYRLQALAGDAAGARALCASLKAAGQACQVKN